MTNRIQRPEQVFVRCPYHFGNRGAIVHREKGSVATGQLKNFLEATMPMSHGICKGCLETQFRENPDI